MKAAILRIEGTNCEEEAYLSFQRLGMKTDYIHLNELISGKKTLTDYHILFMAGGFSAGDYIRAGAIFASRIKSTIYTDLEKYIDDERLIIGICNGFQILIELGLLPAIGGNSEIPQAALKTNDSNKFECRPAYIKNENNGKCKFTSKLKKGEILNIPIAHAEGKLVFPENKKEEYLQSMIEHDQIVFKYVDDKGEYAGYPWNPNGSIENIAGICNEQGTVLGMMPHPERVFYPYQHSDWTRTERKGDGRKIFESAIEYVQKKF
jgi:phosphoribosylformylglycinamidine synthase